MLFILQCLAHWTNSADAYAAPQPPALQFVSNSTLLVAWSSFIEYSVCLEHAVYFSLFWSLDQTVLMLMLRIRTTSVESPVLFLHLAACFAERGGLLSAAYDKRQSTIYGRYLSLVSLLLIVAESFAAHTI